MNQVVMNDKKGYVCSCFFTYNIFLPEYELHVTFLNREQFLREYDQSLRLKGCSSEHLINEVIKQIQKEIHRRNSLPQKCIERCLKIAQSYKPLNAEVYKLQESFLAPEFLSIIKYCKTGGANITGLIDMIKQERAKLCYSFPVFTEEFCHSFLEEIMHFENSDLPVGRPNTMNNHGVLLNELGFDEEFLIPLRECYLIPLAGLLYPEYGGEQLNSHKAFIVKYKIGQDLSLSYHYDNSEVTINICLGRTFTGGELYFGGMRDKNVENTECCMYENIPTFGVIHRGQHMHGAVSVTSGERFNLVIWMRSSKIRNRLCPMCNKTPDLVAVVGINDGFTKECGGEINVCCAQ